MYWDEMCVCKFVCTEKGRDYTDYAKYLATLCWGQGLRVELSRWPSRKPLGWVAVGYIARHLSLPSAESITWARSPCSAGLGLGFIPSPMAVWGSHIGGLFMISFIIIIMYWDAMCVCKVVCIEMKCKFVYWDEM